MHLWQKILMIQDTFEKIKDNQEPVMKSTQLCNYWSESQIYSDEETLVLLAFITSSMSSSYI